MDISYKNNGKNKFMIISGVNIEEDDYKTKMVLNNKINAIVPMNIKRVNNQDELYYNITSLISLEDLFAREKVTEDFLYVLALQINQLLESVREYLLSIDCMLLKLKFIFYNYQEKRYYFCYFPEMNINYQEQLRKLFTQILEYVDYSDKSTIKVAYGVQQFVTETDFAIQDIAEYIVKNKREIQNTQCSNENMNKEQEQEVFDVPKEQKKGFFELLFHKNKYETECELNTKIENKEQIRQKHFKEEVEEETTLLAIEEKSHRLVLVCHDRENCFRICPKTFPYIIGKSERQCDFVINRPVVSRAHLKIIRKEKGYFIEDLCSTNGTFLNNQRLYPDQLIEINAGDIITIADLELTVETFLETC